MIPSHFILCRVRGEIRILHEILMVLMLFLYCSDLFCLFRWSSMRRSCVRRSATRSRTFMASGTFVLHFCPRLRPACLSEVRSHLTHLTCDQKPMWLQNSLERHERRVSDQIWECFGKMAVCLSSRFCPSVKAPSDRCDEPWCSVDTCRLNPLKNQSSIHLTHHL